MSQKRASQRSYAEWDRLVDEWGESGQTQKEFAEAHGINAKTFQGRVWRSQRRRGFVTKGKAEPCGFVEVAAPSPVASKGRGECRITVSNLQVEFSSSSEAAWITEILSKLGYGK
jgi:transposase-like protein